MTNTPTQTTPGTRVRAASWSASDPVVRDRRRLRCSSSDVRRAPKPSTAVRATPKALCQGGEAKKVTATTIAAPTSTTQSPNQFLICTSIRASSSRSAQSSPAAYPADSSQAAPSDAIAGAV